MFVTHSGGSLNPTWVEWLMNWPIGWTSLEPLPKDYFEDWKRKTQENAWWYRDPSETPLSNGEIVSRIALSVSNRVNRLEAIGNGQVPSVVVEAWSRLFKRIGEGI